MALLDCLLQENLEVAYLKEPRKGQKDRYSYDVIFNEMTDEGRQILFEKLHNQYSNETIKISCRCNPKASINMIPVKGESTFYLRTQQGKKGLHVPGCNFEGTHQSYYHANWQEDEQTGKIRVRFRDSFVTEKPAKNPPTGSDGDSDELGSFRDRKHTFNRITLYAFFMRLLLDVWNVNMRNYVKALNGNKTPTYPSLSSLYKSIESHWSEKIVFGKGNDLKRVLYSGKGDITKAAYSVGKQFNLCLMVILYFEEIKEVDEEYYLITGRHLSNNAHIDILCETHKWGGVLSSLHGIEGPYLVGGWVTNTGYGKPAEFRSIALLPISSHGVIVDSSYERVFYDECHKLQRMIIRPYNLKYFPNWSGMLPDGLFLDTNPNSIVEIFGMSENQEEYHDRRNQKIAHFSQLHAYRKPFGFWYWEAYADKKMPPLPEPVKL